ncbi:MAG TPA: 16S rRNA processing protein RimM [Thermoanaerobacterales bacterium]|nr:16S rRNA processing protein RimM [Thermoanaerobacterales bacterium]
MDYLTVGKIISLQGNKGELKVMPLTDDITRFERLSSIYLDMGNDLKEFQVEDTWYHKNCIIIKLAGIDSIEDAKGINKCYMKVKLDDAIELPHGHYFIFELINCKVFTHEGIYLGKIIEILETGSNDVYIVKNDSDKPIYIPAIKDVVKKIDVENKLVEIQLIEGLI